MDILLLIIHILEIIIFAYLGFAALYIFIYAVAGKIIPAKKLRLSNERRKFAVLIPAYKEDAVIIDVAKQALKQLYPENKYDVIVIADSFKEETLTELRKLNITLIEVNFEKSTKSKALNKAMEEIGDEYDIALILDADNIMNSDVISKLNEAFDEGFLAIQAHRVAKNTNTSFAILDAISEEVNNHIYRKGHRALGLSSALIGSGMAFDYKFFKNIMKNINAVGGFDKELELKLLKDGRKIEYLHNALVLDEKVQKTDVFANQRKRWLSAQFVYFGRYFKDGIVQLFTKANIDFADKVYQMIQPPRILLLGLSFIITLFWTIIQIINPDLFSELFFRFYSWIIVFGFVFIAFVISIPLKFYNYKTLKALAGLPKSFLIMALSLFKLKGANKTFIHTTHGEETDKK